MDFDALTSMHVVHILGDVTGMVSTAFEITGNQDIVGTAGDMFGVFHHIADRFTEDGNIAGYGNALLYTQPDYREDWRPCGKNHRTFPPDYGSKYR
jgi:hypothetical protein